MSLQQRLFLVDVATSVSTAISTKRRLLRYISTHSFREMFNALDDQTQQHLKALIDKDDLKGLESWVDRSKAEEYGHQTVRYLRLLGKKLGVPHYQVLSKATLLSEIVQYEKDPCSKIATGSPP